jgi:hypothetical protein
MRQNLVLSLACAALTLTPTSRVAAGAGVLRTVYFSAADASGAAVGDLTPADLAVKEGGKERAIDSVGPATEKMQVFLLVDDGGSGAFQGSVAQFIETTQGRAQVSISALNPQPMRLTEFTENFDEFKTAIGRLGPRGKIQTVGEQIIGAVEFAAKELVKRKAARPSIVVMTVGGEQPQSTEADPALNALKASGASLSVVYLRGVELGKVLGDGPKRSGGMAQDVSAGVALGPVLDKIAQNLLHQYVLTYTLPEGTKPNERFELTTSRKGVTLLAPSRVPDK